MKLKDLPWFRSGAARRSFTLIELLVVMAIMGVVMGIAVYQFRNGEVHQDLNTAADDIKAAWQEMRARSLAATRTPAGAQYYNNADASNRPVVGYGLLMFGTTNSDGLHLICPVHGGQCFYWPTHQLVQPSFIIQACAVPTEEVVPEQGRSPVDRCFVPIQGYSPVLPSNVYIERSSIRVGSTTHDMYPFMVPDGLGQTFREVFNFSTCTPGPGDEDVIQIYTASVFLGIEPPTPRYFMNGYSGCKILQFKLKSTLNDSVQLWIRFDLNTGTVQTFDREPDTTVLPG